MYSHLTLAEGGPNDDGLLEAWELMQLELKAELAVLSARVSIDSRSDGQFPQGSNLTGWNEINEE